MENINTVTMKRNILTHITDVKVLDVIDSLVDDIGIITMNIDDYEEFFHALIHMKPAMFIAEINNRNDPYLKIIQIIRKSAITQDIPIVVLTNNADEHVLDLIVELDIQGIIYPPVVKSIVKFNLINVLEKLEYKESLEVIQDMQTVQSVMISSLASLAEYRDPETGEHIKRTQNYVKALAIEMKKKGLHVEELSSDNIESIYMSVPLHDIGKVGIRDEILLKPGRLTCDEFEIMKRHTTLGYEAILNVGLKLKNSTFLEYSADVAYTHHEKYDGSGYPRGLAGEEIPLIGRLMAVADVYDALISKRVYKEAMTHQEAMEILVTGSGSHFDPEVIDCVMTLETTFQNIAQTYADTDVLHNEKIRMMELLHKGYLKRVLIVEDSRIVRVIMKNQLLAMGFDVDEAEDGEVGLKLIKKHDYDLVLLDIEMPRMNGYEMAMEVKALNKSVILIAMTAADYNVTLSKLKEYNIRGLLLKPVDFNKLATKYYEIVLMKEDYISIRNNDEIGHLNTVIEKFKYE